MNLRLIIVELCLPVVVCLGLILAVPHVIAKSIVPALGMSLCTLLDLVLSICCTVSNACAKLLSFLYLLLSVDNCVN